MGRSRNSLDDWPDESDGSPTGPKPGRPGRIYALPGGGLAILILLLAGLVWVAHDRPNHSTSNSNPVTFRRHSSPPAAVAFAPADLVLATAHYDGSLKILDLDRDPDHPRVIEADPGNTLRAVAFSPDGKRLLSGGEGPTLKLWDVGSGTLRASLDGPGSPVYKLAFSPDGKTIASGSLDGTVTLQDVETGREISRQAGHLGSIRGLAFSPDGATLAVGALQGDVRIWDVTGGRVRVAIHYQRRTIDNLAFAPDGKRLALALGGTDSDQKSEVVIWTVAGGHEAIRVLGEASDARVAFSPDGKTLAASCGQFVKLWDVESGREFASLEGHDGLILSLAFSPDGQLLATGGGDMLVGLFPINFEKLKASRF